METCSRRLATQLSRCGLFLVSALAAKKRLLRGCGILAVGTWSCSTCYRRLYCVSEWNATAKRAEILASPEPILAEDLLPEPHGEQHGIVLIDLMPPLLQEEVWNIFQSKLIQVGVTGDRQCFVSPLQEVRCRLNLSDVSCTCRGQRLRERKHCGDPPAKRTSSIEETSSRRASSF